MTKPRSPGALLFQRLLRRRIVVASLAVIVLIVGSAILAPWIAPYAPTKMDIVHRLKPPVGLHWFGTDDFGRDVLTRTLYGARVSLSVGLMVVVLASVLGTALGLFAGYVRKLDAVLMRFTDALMAFPDILLAIALLAGLGPSLFNVVLALGIVYTPRVARSCAAPRWCCASCSSSRRPRRLGAGDARIMLVHLLPNLVSPLIVQGTFIFAYRDPDRGGAVFLGAGVPPTTPTWGNMIAGAQQYMSQADWLILAPGLAIVLTVLSLQIVGDGLRDALDPKLQRLM
jgi:peptide/nickel transport system permease protein